MDFNVSMQSALLLGLVFIFLLLVITAINLKRQAAAKEGLRRLEVELQETREKNLVPEKDKHLLERQLRKCNEGRIVLSAELESAQTFCPPVRRIPQNISLPVTETTEASAPVEIVTRTSKKVLVPVVDNWQSERVWKIDEEELLERLYKRGLDVRNIALQMKLDAKDIVYRIARSKFGCVGDLENLQFAPNHGRTWLTQDIETLEAGLDKGKTVKQLAFSLGRTELAIVWQVIDRGMGRES